MRRRLRNIPDGASRSFRAGPEPANMAGMQDVADPGRPALRHSTNLVGRPTDWLDSCAYNDAPAPLHIWGVREMNNGLFGMLEGASDLAEAGHAFTAYMRAMFGVDREQVGEATDGRPFRSSFVRLIRGWSFDSNGTEGAVLKGWVESRFGVCPSFHKSAIEAASGAAWATYVEEKMASRFHDNAIWVQLDLLFEYGQWAMRRFVHPDETHLTLYRGVNGLGDHRIVERTSRGEAVVRLNNLVSFTSDRSVADCFGDEILTVRVPVPKILFFNDLLPSHVLKGEREFLAIGGEYRVRADYI